MFVFIIYRFDYEDQATKKTTNISIGEYFEKVKKYRLKYPLMPVLIVAKRQALPVEVTYFSFRYSFYYNIFF